MAYLVTLRIEVPDLGWAKKIAEELQRLSAFEIVRITQDDEYVKEADNGEVTPLVPLEVVQKTAQTHT